MNEALKLELQELTNLEVAGGLDESQKSRLDVLRIAEQAEQTALQKQKDLESALAQKDHFRTKFEKEEADRKTLEASLNKAAAEPVAAKSLDVSEIIGINAALEGLSQREQEKLVEDHKLTGRPLPEIRKSEDFLLWQQGYQQKVEKERALIPNGAQPDGDAPKTLSSRIKELNTSKNFKANLAEQEELLKQANLYKAPRVNPNRQSIG